MSKLKVLLLLHELSLSGAPKVILDIFDAIAPQLDVKIIVPDSGPLADRAGNLGEVTLLAPMLTSNSRVQRNQRRQLETSLASWRPDLIYINSVAALKIVNIINLPSTPVLLHVHELDAAIYILTKGIKDLFTSYPDRFIGVSQPVVDLLKDHYGIPVQKIALIHECIPDDFGSVREPPSAPNAMTKFVVGGAGSLGLRKGTDLWLQMARELLAVVGPDKVRFVWVGAQDGPDKSMIEEIARKLGLTDHVEFVPVTNDPAAFYEQFDVFAMTSWEDPCPLVVLENMILQKPVICFNNSGGAPDEVGETGIVIDDFSPFAMAQAIAQLMDAPEKRMTMGRDAKMRVESLFTISVQAPKIYAEIANLVNKVR